MQVPGQRKLTVQPPQLSLTVVEAVLFDVTGSWVLALTVTLSSTLVFAFPVSVTMKVSVCDDEAAMVPSEQTTVPV